MKKIASEFRKVSGVALTTVLLGSSVHAAQLIPIGDLPGGDTNSTALDLSADGNTVLGLSSDDAGTRGFRWSAESGFSLLPEFDVQSFSGDGGAVVGSLYTDKLNAIRWTEAAGVIALGTPEAPGADPFSVALDASYDGALVVGAAATVNSTYSEAVLWHPVDGIVPLGFLAADQPEEGFPSFSFANAISANGQVIVGGSASTKHTARGEQAFRWTKTGGMEPLGFLPGAFQSQAMAVSSNGTVIVGISGLEAFRWTETAGMHSIGAFLPLAVSADGTIVVGRADTENGSVAQIWTEEQGTLPLTSVLQAKGIAADGWSFSELVGVSDDGLKLAGNGMNPSGTSEAFVVIFDPPVPPTSGSVTISGPVNVRITDPSGASYSSDAGTGSANAIPGLTVESSGGSTTIRWPNILDGSYLVDLTASGAGTYTLNLNFAHEYRETSGQPFSGTVGAGGRNNFSATISAETAATSVFVQTFADSDGDNVIDANDAFILSDLRPTIFIGTFNTGVKNQILPTGATINDLVGGYFNQSRSRSEFSAAMTKGTTEWTRTGTVTKSEAKKLISQALRAEHPNWKRYRK